MDRQTIRVGKFRDCGIVECLKYLLNSCGFLALKKFIHLVGECPEAICIYSKRNFPKYLVREGRW